MDMIKVFATLELGGSRSDCRVVREHHRAEVQAIGAAR